MADSGNEIDLKMSGAAEGDETPPRIRGRLEGEGGILSQNLKPFPTAVLRVATSFDSENDSSDFHLTTTPLHNLRTPRDKPVRHDTILEDFEEQADFKVADGADFEILPDDDDCGEEESPIASLKRPPTGNMRSSETLPEATTIAKPPSCSPPTTPPSSPSTSRTLLHRLSAPLSPRQRSNWKQQGELTPIIEFKDGKTTKFRLFQHTGTDTATKSPGPGAFRAFRTRAMAAYKGNDPDSGMGTDEWAQEEGSSSEDSSVDSDDDGLSSDNESTFDDGRVLGSDEVVDFSSVPPVPNSFLDLPPDVYDYLDPDLVKNIADQDISTFAYEHHLLIKGLLHLLAERDIVGVEGDIHDTSNVLKMGPLKKKSTRGLWGVKYVEIRRGNMSYFADDPIQLNSENRKTIHLRKRTCKCEAAKDGNSSGSGYVFRLMIEGGPKKHWMAQSEEERQGWIRAINQAMIGEGEGIQGGPINLSMYQNAIESYQSVQASLQEVKTRQDYLMAVDSLLYRKSSSSALRIPMNWIRDEVLKGEESQKNGDSPDEQIRTSISETWKDFCTTSVDINGCFIEANTVYSAERVIGTLCRCILEFDKVDYKEAGIGDQSTKSVKSRSDKDASMTEVEAVSYARSILVGVLHSQRRGDVMSAVQHLVQNDDVARVMLESSEPLHIDVSFAGDDFSEREQTSYDMSGWLQTRSKRSKIWKQRFFVISAGVLSYFAHAEPRPYGLRGQLVLSKCSIKAVDDLTLQIHTNDDNRLLRFGDRGIWVKWRSVLDRAVDPECPTTTTSAATEDSSSQPPTPRGKRRNSVVGNVKPLKTASDTGVKVGKRAMKAMKGAKNKIRSARGMIARGMGAGRQRGQRNEPLRRTSTQAMLMISTRGIAKSPNQKREPTVQAVIELNSVIKVMPVGSSDDDEPLLVVRVKLYQAFLLSGGPNGRLSSGDELIEMEFLGMEEDGDHEFLEAPTSL